MTKADLINRLQRVDDNAEIIVVDEESNSELSIQDIFTVEDEFATLYVKQIS